MGQIIVWALILSVQIQFTWWTWVRIRGLVLQQQEMNAALKIACAEVAALRQVLPTVERMTLPPRTILMVHRNLGVN